ncbi:MAG: cytochrome c3 family protein [Candidatus Methylomirabilia bacterium]
MQRTSEARGARRAPGFRAWSIALLVALFAIAWCGLPAPAAAVDRTDCFGCHDGSDGPTVDEKLFDQTVHADLDCTDCHGDVKDVPHDAPLKKVDCSQCHDKVQAVYNGSIHGTAQKSGVKEAARCPDCHGRHNIFSPKDSRSTVYPLNLVETCGSCHSNAALAKKYEIPVADAYQKYKVSVHGRALLRSGLVVSAVCNDCHGTHDILPHTDPKSRINYKNIRTTCGVCHTGVLEQFDQSVHGKALVSGATLPSGKGAPTCIVCHHSHSITRITEEDWKLHNLVECGNCHSDRINTYRETYHGQVTSLGYAKVARCSDCHGSHNILPESDPKSTLAAGANKVQTCRKCHPQANENFTKYMPHGDHKDREKYPILFYTFYLMTALLFGTFGFFGLHTLLWLIRSLKEKHKAPPLRITEEKMYWRFDLFQRTLHFMIIVSFLTLAMTGIPLKFSYTPWAKTLASFLGGFEAAGFVHRTMGVVTFCYFMLHLGSLLRRILRGEQGLFWGPGSMVPQLKDLEDLIGTIKWFLGAGPRPKYDRFTYWEKFDYWAVFWGVGMIGVSGLVLWFPTFAAKLLPGWAFNIAMIIHSDEAILATGFIFAIHFFNSHLRPEKFPMDFVIFTGRVHVDELKHERPLEYERVKASGELEKRMGMHVLPWQYNGARVFGFIALAVGLTLLVLMLSVMFLGH